MAKFEDLTGRIFGHLTVLYRGENSPAGAVTWKCKCDCGGYRTARAAALLGGDVISCGCISSAPKGKPILTAAGKRRALAKTALLQQLADMFHPGVDRNG